MPNSTPLILLDRDGVINRDSPDYILSPAAWVPLPGSLAAIAQLTAAGYEIHVITNQSAVGRGMMSAQTLEDIHRKMLALVSEAGGQIQSIQICPHRPDQDCNCRKPKTGLLENVARLTGQSLQGVWFLGDKLSDVETAIRFGCRPGLVMSGPKVPDQQALTVLDQPISMFTNLAAFVEEVLGISTR